MSLSIEYRLRNNLRPESTSISGSSTFQSRKNHSFQQELMMPLMLRYSILFFVCVLFYFISDYLIENYHWGDRFHYRNFYEAAETVRLKLFSFQEISDVFDLQKNYTGSGEPLYGIFVWIFSHFLENNEFLNFINMILVGSLMLFLLSYRVPYWVIGLALSNFYFLVLLTSAERLKFSVLMLLLAMLTSGSWTRGIFLLAAPLFHVQTFILYAALFVGQQFARRRKAGAISGNRLRTRIIQIFFGFVVLVIILRYRSYISDKMSSYANFDGDLFGIIVLTIASFLTFKKTIYPTMAVASLGFASLVLGDSRVNMIGYVAYLYYCVTLYKTNNVFYFVLSLYFSYKSIGYVQRVIAFGDGFASV